MTTENAIIEFHHIAGEDRLPFTKWSRLDVVVNGTYRAKITYTRPGCGATIIKLVDLETGTVVDSREMGAHGFNADVNHIITREMVRTALARGWWV